MNFKDFKSIKISGNIIKKLTRTRDGLVLFDKTQPPTPEPQPWFALEYDGSYSNIFIGSLFAGLYGGSVEIDWGNGTSETVNVPSGGGSVQIRRDDIYETRTIRFKAPATFFVPNLTALTRNGITKLIDLGDNISFRNTLDSSGRTQPGTFNWRNLNTIDLRLRTSVPNLTQANYFDQNTNLTQIIIPSSLESQFRSNSNWNQYASKFVIA